MTARSAMRRSGTIIRFRLRPGSRPAPALAGAPNPTAPNPPPPPPAAPAPPARGGTPGGGGGAPPAGLPGRATPPPAGGRGAGPQGLQELRGAAGPGQAGGAPAPPPRPRARGRPPASCMRPRPPAGGGRAAALPARRPPPRGSGKGGEGAPRLLGKGVRRPRARLQERDPLEGERRDSNPRPPGPQPGALPAELRPPRGRPVAGSDAVGSRNLAAQRRSVVLTLAVRSGSGGVPATASSSAPTRRARPAPCARCAARRAPAPWASGSPWCGVTPAGSASPCLA